MTCRGAWLRYCLLCVFDLVRTQADACGARYWALAQLKAKVRTVATQRSMLEQSEDSSSAKRLFGCFPSLEIGPPSPAEHPAPPIPEENPVVLPIRQPKKLQRHVSIASFQSVASRMADDDPHLMPDAHDTCAGSASSSSVPARQPPQTNTMFFATTSAHQPPKILEEATKDALGILQQPRPPLGLHSASDDLTATQFKALLKALPV